MMTFQFDDRSKRVALYRSALALASSSRIVQGGRRTYVGIVHSETFRNKRFQADYLSTFFQIEEHMREVDIE